MKIAIYGAGKCGKYIVDQIQACKNAKVEVSVLIDNNPDFNSQTKYGIPVVSLESFVDLYYENVECVLVATFDEFVAQSMIVSLLNKKYTNIYFLPEMYDWEEEGGISILDSDGNMSPYIEHTSNLKPSLEYLEYHVSDYCNLKCKRCGHLSNLAKARTFPNIDGFRIELQGLSKNLD